jgi:hypothetical protein
MPLARGLRNVFASILIIAASTGWAQTAGSKLVSVRTPRGAAQHGFFGIESEAVDKVAGFVKANSK